MSFIDLATLTLHRRTELEGRINQFSEKCDQAINEIKKLKTKAQGFVLQLNCEPSELKECFLSCMKQLDEYMYLITDFNLSAGKIEETGNAEYTPVLDTTSKILLPTPPVGPFNLLDALSEPTPSTSRACSNLHQSEKLKKAPRDEQLLIVFSSASCSSESVPQSKNEIQMVTKEVQCTMAEEISNVTLEDAPSPLTEEPCRLPAQSILELDHSYQGTIMHIDGAYFYVMIDDVDEVYKLMTEMTNYYKENHRDLGLEEVKSLIYCALLDEDCYYRGLFINLVENDCTESEVFLVDTGEMRRAPTACVQPLHAQFCAAPPYARRCHLAGVDLLCYQDNNLMEKLEAFMNNYVGATCNFEVDDNTSESLGVYVLLPTNETLNEILTQQGLAHATFLGTQCTGALQVEEDPPTRQASAPTYGPPELGLESELDITQCPEYEDPVEAVTGYHNRDEADICKHYKGGPEKTCFKGSRCTKKHVVKHPDGWTLDRVEVIGKCKSVPLPEPGSWLKVRATCVCHFDRVFVQIVKDKEIEEVPDFGVVLPPMTLTSLVRDMNSAATRLAYQPLKMTPAPGELVAALYPFDNNWYRARIQSLSRADQNVEVMYVDYGTVMSVKEDQIRVLEARYTALPLQAVQCVLAGVFARSHCSQQWAKAKKAFADMVQDKILDAHVIARDYDEITVELYDQDGYSIAEQLAALNMVELREYTIVGDSNVPQKVIVP